jgi:Spy/CpxP family protein refolding chaperone
MFGKKLSAVLLLSLAVTAGAQAGGRMDKMADALDLTQEQTVQFKALHQEKRDAMNDHKSERKLMKQGFVDLLDNYSEQQAQSLADQAAEMARKHSLARFQQSHKIYSMLDDEQKITFKKMMMKHKGGKRRFGHGGEHHGGHRD